MKRKKRYIALITILLFITVGCSKEQKDETKKHNEEIYEKNNSKEEVKTVKAIINENEYIINLEDNETVNEFINHLPQEFNMSELNGNEKYTYLDYTLPSNSYNPKEIKAGDVMLYGDNCIVIFYKSFKTNYSYTKIGHISNLPNLGSKEINVKITK